MDCTKCTVKSCRTAKQCHAQQFETESVLSFYHLPETARIVQAAATLVDHGRAGTMSRLQEIVEFAKLMNFQRIGIAYCYGMEKESGLISSIFKDAGFKTSPVSCTTGGLKQSDINISCNIEKVACNPIAQAEQLNNEAVDFTITVGLCMGHDILFNKYIKSYATTLIVKDRVYNHNPGKAISLEVSRN